MTQSPPIDLPTAIPCHRCGYDVRAQPADGRCPECAASVAESRRLALIPRRPAWRDSDPRWRRRMLAGAWVLVLVPLLAVPGGLHWTERIPAPIFSDVERGQMLNETYLFGGYQAPMFCTYLLFCIGVVLLFSKERGRQVHRLDWTRRWGVIGSYTVLVFGVPVYAFVTALVIVGIAAMFQAMPPPYQPAVTSLFVKLGTSYIYYGPHPTPLADAALAGFSSVVILLAGVPLFNALRSSGPKVLAAILLAPLALTAAAQAAYAVLCAPNLNLVDARWLWDRLFYFDPTSLALAVADFSGSILHRDVMTEAAKWFACVGVAVWLTVAQVRAVRGRANRGAAKWRTVTKKKPTA